MSHPSDRRLLDVALVLLASPLWIPLLLASAWAVLRQLGRPVLFSQERLGRDGRPFRLYKLRTMLPVGPAADTDEERLTPLGRRLRSASLDELPSLVNVLRGELSLVGPRPLPVAYLPRFGPRYVQRLNVRPGVTGWAQVNGRNSVGWAERFELDLWYVENASFYLDLKILLLTVWRVLRRADISADDHATMTEFRGFPEGRQRLDDAGLRTGGRERDG